MQLREKHQFYSKKTQQIEHLAKLSQTQRNAILLSPLQNYFQKQFVSQNQSERQLSHLKKQLLQLDLQLQEQLRVQKQQDSRIINLIDQIEQYQKQEIENSHKFKQLADSYQHQTLQKQVQLTKLKQLFETTNFISIIYSISFENDSAFLNGEKVIVDNCWKIVEILKFYHFKYQNYKPLLQISIDTMSVIPSHSLVSLIKYGQGQKFPKINNDKTAQTQDAVTIEISCEEEDLILIQWMPYVIAEMKKIFQFLKRQAGMGEAYRLKYEATSKGQFQFLSIKRNLSVLERFGLTIKYLLTDIEQINKLQFFVRQKMLKSRILRKFSEQN